MLRIKQSASFFVEVKNQAVYHFDQSQYNASIGMTPLVAISTDVNNVDQKLIQ